MIKGAWIATIAGAGTGVILLIFGAAENNVMHLAAFAAAACSVCVIPYVTARSLAELSRAKKAAERERAAEAGRRD